MANMRMNPTDPASQARYAQASAQYMAAQAPYLRQSSAQSPVQRQAPGPVYVSSSAGNLVNVRDGAVRTEFRTIFVANIDFKATAKELQRFLGRAGEVLKCQLPKDSAGKLKGNATVEYRTAGDAENAVRMFHDEKFMSMRLKVRLAKEAVAVGTPAASSSTANGQTVASRTAQQSRNSTEPIIVNGSVCQK